MNTPICDFVRTYQQKHTLRLHMPGHKGRSFLGAEPWDLTEIAGADELYHARGIIRKSEENAAQLFGTGKTVYSTEGSSLCIRAMIYLALLWGKENGRKPLILAGRNAHKAFLSAAALLDFDVAWLYPEQENHLISCPISAAYLESALKKMPALPVAVYITSPDYLGHIADVSAFNAVCRKYHVLLLVDNAHGAYLKFLPTDRHPMTLGADLCCDSAHKTLPVLTGGAYLHIRPNAPESIVRNAEDAMALFASSSPSYLILQSLDQCNAYLANAYSEKLSGLISRISSIKKALLAYGWKLEGEEPLKLTIMPKVFGYTGDALHQLLRENNMECEFSDPDFLTIMFTLELKDEDMNRLESVLLAIPRKQPISVPMPPLPHPQQAISIREAALSPRREISVKEALDSIFAEAHVSCPPCIPIIACGERIDEAALKCFQYYGIDTCRIVKE